MIRLIVGRDSESVRQHCLHSLRSAGSDVVWIDETRGPQRGWAFFRLLLPQLRELAGDAVIEESLARNRSVAALILGRLREPLDQTERQEFDRIKAKRTSHLSHNWTLDRPVLHGLAAILADVLRVRRVPIFVANVLSPDPTTLALIGAIFHRMLDEPPDLTIGFAPGSRPREIDEHGIVWGYTDQQEQSMFRTLRALPGPFLRDDVSAAATPCAGEAPVVSLDRWDDDLDGQAAAVLSQEAPLSGEEIERVLAGIERSFEMFCRDVTLQLALSARLRCPHLPPAQETYLVEMIGLAAHNWLFDTARGNQDFSTFLERHFRRALELEEDPELRIAQLYRLAVTLGRRKKKYEEAMVVANQAIQEARHAPIPKERQIYQEIWTRNIRAYLFMRQNRLDEAFEDSNECLRLVQQLTHPIEKASVDYKFTRTTVADNNVVLSKIAGRTDLVKKGIERNILFLEEDPVNFGARFSAVLWIAQHREHYRLDEAIRFAEYGLRDSGTDYIKFRWCYLAQLADLHYRLGQSEQALGYLEESKSLRRIVAKIEDLPFLTLPLTASRAGQFDCATAGFEAALEHPAASNAGMRAEILAALGIALAGAGDRSGAENAINQAIDLAVEEGQRDILLSVARSAGRVAESVGNLDEALEAYERGWEIASTSSSDEPSPAGDVLGILVGLARCGRFDQTAAETALNVLPVALHDDPDSWWELSGFLPHLSPLLNDGSPHLSEESLHNLPILMVAARQRQDCAPYLQHVLKRVPSSALLEAGGFWD